MVEVLLLFLLYFTLFIGISRSRQRWICVELARTLLRTNSVISAQVLAASDEPGEINVRFEFISNDVDVSNPPDP